ERRHASVHRRAAVQRPGAGQAGEEPFAELPLVRRDELPADVLEVLDRRDEAGEQLMRERAGLEAVADRERIRRAHLVRPPRLEQLAPAERETEMGAVELVRRAEQH